MRDVDKLPFEHAAPVRGIVYPQSRQITILGAKSTNGGIFEHLGLRIVYQNGSSIRTQLAHDLIEQEIENFS